VTDYFLKNSPRCAAVRGCASSLRKESQGPLRPKHR